QAPARFVGDVCLSILSFELPSLSNIMLTEGPLCFFFFKQKTAYEIGLGIPAEPLFRSQATTNQNVKKRPACSELRWAYCNHKATYFASYLTGGDCVPDDQN